MVSCCLPRTPLPFGLPPPGETAKGGVGRDGLEPSLYADVARMLMLQKILILHYTCGLREEVAENFVPDGVAGDLGAVCFLSCKLHRGL